MRGDATTDAEAERPTGIRTAVEAFRIRNFRMFWIGGVISNTGRFFQAIAIPLVIYQLTESAAWVGLAGFAQLLPTALMGPVAGALADRYPRRSILLVTQTLQALATVLLVVMWFGGVRSPGAYIGAAALGGVAAGFNLPAWQAFVSELVPRELLLSAITLNSAQFNAARLFGPALAGVVVAAFGPGWAFTINAVSYGAVVVALLLMRLPRLAPAPTEPMRPVREFVETLGYVRARPGIITAIATVSLIGFFGITMQVLSVVMAEEVFDRGGDGYGLMVSMIGLGAVLATPVVTSLAGRVTRSRIEEGSLLLYGAGIITLGLAPVFEVALLGLVVMGAAHIATASTLNTAIQLQVDESVRAKVLSVYLTTLLLANPLGQLVLGQLIERVGPRATIAGAGAVLLVTALGLGGTGRLKGLDGEVGSYDPAAAAVAHPTVPVPPRRADA